ncbi:unnamed protein product [Polarella glacialis]|uniref:Uncharacterized protein n=1 Tax=Polarella glacialis TaxID=89957 RepID=A0A813JET2_POLGL|nr:unnamed protein product [Polarella glacialis]
MDRFLTPLSEGWFHPAYRDRNRGGDVNNIDVFCVNPHDPDLRAVIEGYVTHSRADRAKEIALLAIEEWQKAGFWPNNHFSMN